MSNELRYHGVFAGRFSLTTGVYYFNNDIDYHERRNLLGLLTPDGSPALTQDGGGEYEWKLSACSRPWTMTSMTL